MQDGKMTKHEGIIMQSVHMILGPPASGKTTTRTALCDELGCVHLSRDEAGGRVIDLLPKLTAALKKNKSVVLDNLFATADSRKPFIEAAQQAGVPVHAHLMNAKIEDAQINALHRMWQRYGQVFMTADDIKVHAEAKKDPNIWPVAVLFKYRKQAEKPTKTEGFASIEKVKFVRRPLGPEYKNKAVIFDYDGTLRYAEGGGRWPTDPGQVRLLPNRKKIVQHLANDGYLFLGVSNQSPISKGLPEEVAVACFERTNELLGQKIEYHYCPHRVPPITCYCRKPHSGFGVMLIEKHKLNPAECIFVGDAGSDRTFAGRLGFQFAEADKFF